MDSLFRSLVRLYNNSVNSKIVAILAVSIPGDNSRTHFHCKFLYGNVKPSQSLTFSFHRIHSIFRWNALGRHRNFLRHTFLHSCSNFCWVYGLKKKGNWQTHLASLPTDKSFSVYSHQRIFKLLLSCKAIKLAAC